MEHTLTPLQAERVKDLIDLGTNFNKVSEAIGLSLYDTMVFFTEDYQYKKLLLTLSHN